ncbi:unnamed protein product [Coccothraustes coccothraustes]
MVAGRAEPLGAEQTSEPSGEALPAVALSLRHGPGSALPKPPWRRGLNGNSATRHSSCEPKPGTGQRASGILPCVIDPVAGDTTPPPAESGMGTEAPHPGGDRIKQTRPAPVIPSVSLSSLPLPQCHSLSLHWLPPLRNPAARVCRHRAPGGAAVPGRAVPSAGGRARSRSPRPAGDSRGAVPCPAVPCPAAERRLLQHQEQLQVWLDARPAELSRAVPRRAEPFRAVPRFRAVPVPPEPR